ncbi:MAG: dipeptidase [Sandaracinaceae bacterium]
MSLEAVELTRDAELVDLHLETYIPPRLWGYDLRRRHDRHWLGGRFFGHLDLPRALDGGLTGAMWSIATNILRGRRGRWRALQDNVAGLRRLLEEEPRTEVVRNIDEYRAARGRGQHAALIAVQGGNAYDDAPHAGALEDVTRVTVMHLSDSGWGHTSSPARLFGSGLTSSGRAFIEQLDEAKIFVDLAHIDREGFWDAVDVHDSRLPLIDTHTGVCGVKQHWRNLDDRQCRAIADSGGVIGIIFEPNFLRARGMPNDAGMVIAHLEHAIDVAGEEGVAIGSDYDGAITPPPDLRDGYVAYYRLVQRMLDRGWTERRIRRIAGLNFLRSFEALRPSKGTTEPLV